VEQTKTHSSQTSDLPIKVSDSPITKVKIIQ